jgi:CyaY protein
MMVESEFQKRVDDILALIESAMDHAKTDIDAELNGGILTLTFENGSKVIVNRQTPNREIWVAAKSGGFHFRYGAATVSGNLSSASGHLWCNTRTGEPLAELLARVIREQAGEVIKFTL